MERNTLSEEPNKMATTKGAITTLGLGKLHMSSF